jgi:uncharacterized membrane protein (UPF0127 family)
MSTRWQLIDRRSGEVVIRQLQLATTWLRRLVGLQFHRSPASDFGLLISPCNSVHTFFVFFSLDIAFLDERGKVLQVRRHVRPWRFILPVRQATSVVETAAGRMPLQMGDEVVVKATSEIAKLPLCIASLAVDAGMNSSVPSISELGIPDQSSL